MAAPNVDPAVVAQVSRLHASPPLAVVAVSGAGGQALHWLLAVAGASRTLLEAQIPYSKRSLSRYLGSEPVQAASAATALEMARAAFVRALQLRDTGAPIFGVGCTASIATDRPKRGDHSCHVGAWTPTHRVSYSVTLVKGWRDRAGEEEVASTLVLRALAEASEVDFDLPMWLDEREKLLIDRAAHPDPIRALLAGEAEAVGVYPDGIAVVGPEVAGGVLAGSFNPVHEGHQRLADAASRILGAEVFYELSIANVDKPDLTEPEVRRRLGMLAGGRPVLLTRAARFFEKARLFSGCTFVIGVDTALRTVDPRYHEGDVEKLRDALREIRRLGCRFMVAGRELADTYRTLADVDVPDEFRDLFSAIPPEAFRSDLSSTELRKDRLDAE